MFSQLQITSGLQRRKALVQAREVCAPVSLAATGTTLRFVLIIVACICLTAVRTFSQSPRPTPIPGTKGASVKLAPKLDARLQHVLQIMLSENRLRTIVQLDREAALYFSKYSRGILAAARLRKGASGLPSAQQLQDLGKKAGAAERRLLVALKEERRHLDREINVSGPISLIRPLKVSAIEVARLVRMRTGSLGTEIPKLGQTAICRGDLVMDRLLYRYARAATAEDDYEVTAALRELQIQLACLSTRQIRIFESALVEAVNRAEITLPAARDPKRLLAIRTAFQQLFAPVIFATADASRLFPQYERPAIKWLVTRQNMLSAAALRKKTITYRVGLLFANRFSGKLTRARGDCGAAAKKIFDDGRGGRTCNALGALYQSVALSCDVTQWVPTGPGAKKFSCELACSGLPGKLSGGRSAAAAGLASLSKVPCPFTGPQVGGGSVGLGTSGDDSGDRPSGGGMPGDGSGGACDGNPMFGVVGFESPTQAYNDAFNSCVMGMAAARGWMRTQEGMSASGYPPGGGKYCVAAGESDESEPTPEEAPSPTEETEAETNLREAKNKVKEMLAGVAAFVNELLGSEVITQDDLDRANTAVDNAQMWETRQISKDGKSEKLGQTSNGGKTIFVSGPMCANDEMNCTVTLLHEALHSALTGTPFAGEDVEHGIIGKELGDSTRFLLDYWASGAPEPGLCLQDNPNCTSGCSSREAAMPDCINAGLTAMGERMREIGQDAKDCAVDACWNPADDGLSSGQVCGDPNPCQGQSVALCMADQPDCMCNSGNKGLDLTAILRNMVWNEYCQRALDDRCGSPVAPLDFGALDRSISVSRPVEAGAQLQAQPMKGFRFGNLTVHANGILRMTGSPILSTGAIDSECISATCRASQRGDW